MEDTAPREYRKLKVNTLRSCWDEPAAKEAHKFATQLVLADSRQFSEINSEFKKQMNYCWSQLEPLVGYLDKQEVEKRIWPSVVVAVHCHLGQKRKSGEPYVIHYVFSNSELERIFFQL